MKNYKLSSSPTASCSFSEASKEELRVLVAVMEAEKSISETDIIRRASVSSARAKGALAFWQEEGIISAIETEIITEEFPERIHIGEILEENSAEVAEAIRNENLKDLLNECADMIEKPTLNNNEIKCIAALVTQYGLTDQYILELAAYLKTKGKLTVTKIRDKAMNLLSKGIDNSESLDVYIRNAECQSSFEAEYRNLLGIYNRALSEGEREMFKKWSDEFGYSPVIVGEAYSVSVLNIGKLSLKYIDKIITSWHESGCKTVEECRALNASVKAAADGEKEKKTFTRKKTKSEAPKPRYGDFDVDDAFEKALERSYNSENK